MALAAFHKSLEALSHPQEGSRDGPPGQVKGWPAQAVLGGIGGLGAAHWPAYAFRWPAAFQKAPSTRGLAQGLCPPQPPVPGPEHVAHQQQSVSLGSLQLLGTPVCFATSGPLQRPFPCPTADLSTPPGCMDHCVSSQEPPEILEAEAFQGCRRSCPLFTAPSWDPAHLGLDGGLCRAEGLLVATWPLTQAGVKLRVEYVEGLGSRQAVWMTRLSRSGCLGRGLPPQHPQVGHLAHL